jgi:hypothetical protein
MDKLNTVVEETLKIAEKGMQEAGHSNPKVVIFYRNPINELETYMIDLAPKKYFDTREEVLSQVGVTLNKMAKTGKIVRNVDIAVAYGEAFITIGGAKTKVLMASGQDSKNNTVTRFKEIRQYLMPEHPEKQFFDLQDFEVKGLKYKSPVLTKLFENIKK